MAAILATTSSATAIAAEAEVAGPHEHAVSSFVSIAISSIGMPSAAIHNEGTDLLNTATQAVVSPEQAGSALSGWE
ncbi:hypothetical protein AAHC03_026997 [Spirometra sp. Aus1]